VTLSLVFQAVERRSLRWYFGLRQAHRQE
jgi:hypothetical protein